MSKELISYEEFIERYEKEHSHNHHSHFHHGMYFKHKDNYRPWYDSNADYNTNSKSYFDYLARESVEITEIINLLNRIARRNLEVKDTDSIDFSKIGDWISENDCDKYSDVIQLFADLKISKQEQKYVFDKLKVKEYELKNILKVLNDGAYAPDFTNVINAIGEEIQDLEKQIKDVNDSITNILKEIEKIWEKISELETLINDTNKKIEAFSGGGDYDILIMGKDYKLTFYNGFYTTDKFMQVGIIDLSDRSIIRIQNGISKDNNVTKPYGLKHDNIQEEFTLRHGDPTDETPKSRIFKIEFLGDYAYLNELRIIEQSSNGIWNMRPVKARASFEIGGSYVTYKNEPLTFVGISYFDGYNTQFTDYTEKLTLTSGNLLSRLTILKPKKEEK